MLAAVDRERKQAMKLVLIDTSFKPDNASASAGRSIPPYAAQRIRAQRADRLRVPQLWLLGALLFAPQLSARFLASARSRLQIQQTLVEVVVVVAMVVAFVVVVVAVAAAAFGSGMWAAGRAHWDDRRSFPGGNRWMQLTSRMMNPQRPNGLKVVHKTTGGSSWNPHHLDAEVAF
jgi:hypothetical protein